MLNRKTLAYLFCSSSVLLALSSCAGDSSPSTGSPDADSDSTDVAPAAIEGVIHQINQFSVLAQVDLGHEIPTPVMKTLPVLKPSKQAAPIVPLGKDEGWGLKLASVPARITLPRLASGRFTLSEAKANLKVEVELEGASPVEGVPHHDLLTYPAGLRGADIIHRVSDNGTEDFVLHRSRPAENTMRYRVHLDGKTSLRLASNSLEFLTSDGDPRLRISPPYVVDANGTTREALLSVEGCAVDTRPGLPWDHPTISPGANECVVKVNWDDKELTYPILVDPSWNGTGALGIARYAHQATRLLGGRVMVAGGYNALTGYLVSSEIYNPATGSWTLSTSVMANRRAYFLLYSITEAGGLVITDPATTNETACAIGGANASGALSAVDCYAYASGTWSPATPMNTPRYVAAGVAAPATGTIPRVIVMGGYGGTGPGTPAYLKTAETFSFGSTWTNVGTWMSLARGYAAASVVPNYAVISGGRDASGAHSSAERLNLSTLTWSSAGSMPLGMYAHSSTRYISGGNHYIYAAGGDDGTKSVRHSFIYDAAANTWGPDALGGALVTGAREWHGAGWTNGYVFLVGGVDFQSSGTTYPFTTQGIQANSTGSSQLVCCASTTAPCTACPTLANVTPRAFAPAVVLNDGRILYAGGLLPSGAATTISEVFNPI